jgi:phosphinothricin acetyltransferase
MMARRTRLLEQGFPYLVAERGGEVIGYAYAGPYRTRPAYRFTVENSVYVRPGNLRQGVGQQLMAALLAECTQKGFRQVIAVIGDSANHASIRLHESLGFSLVGTLRNIGFKFDRWYDSVLMQRKLDEDDRQVSPKPNPH